MAPIQLPIQNDPGTDSHIADDDDDEVTQISSLVRPQLCESRQVTVIIYRS